MATPAARFGVRLPIVGVTFIANDRQSPMNRLRSVRPSRKSRRAVVGAPDDGGCRGAVREWVMGYARPTAHYSTPASSR